MRIEKAFFFLGSGGNGKSTIMKAVENIFQGYIGHVDLNDLDFRVGLNDGSGTKQSRAVRSDNDGLVDPVLTIGQVYRAAGILINGLLDGRGVLCSTVSGAGSLWCWALATGASAGAARFTVSGRALPGLPRAGTSSSNAVKAATCATTEAATA